jgi:hypothetical protein
VAVAVTVVPHQGLVVDTRRPERCNDVHSVVRWARGVFSQEPGLTEGTGHVVARGRCLSECVGAVMRWVRGRARKSPRVIAGTRRVPARDRCVKSRASR